MALIENKNNTLEIKFAVPGVEKYDIDLIAVAEDNTICMSINNPHKYPFVREYSEIIAVIAGIWDYRNIRSFLERGVLTIVVPRNEKNRLHIEEIEG